MTCSGAKKIKHNSIPLLKGCQQAARNGVADRLEVNFLLCLPANQQRQYVDLSQCGPCSIVFYLGHSRDC